MAGPVNLEAMAEAWKAFPALEDCGEALEEQLAHVRIARNDAARQAGRHLVRMMRTNHEIATVTDPAELCELAERFTAEWGHVCYFRGIAHALQAVLS